MTRHVVDAIRFLPRTPGEDAPMRCSCGWIGEAGDFSAHQRAAGVLLSKRNSQTLGPTSGPDLLRNRAQ